MTDNEIIKSLECCADHDNIDACDDCPCLKGKCISTTPYILDLINRQKAEIEKSRENNKAIMQTLADVRESVVKEFAERLKAKINNPQCPWEDFPIRESDIDEVMKEMVGDTE